MDSESAKLRLEYVESEQLSERGIQRPCLPKRPPTGGCLDVTQLHSLCTCFVVESGNRGTCSPFPDRVVSGIKADGSLSCQEL